VISAHRLYIPSVLCRKTALPCGLLSVEGRMNMRNASFELISRGLRLISIVMSGRDQWWLLQTKALTMIIFVNILLDKGIIITVPMATPQLRRLQALVLKAA
jgi:hypothetical protein